MTLSNLVRRSLSRKAGLSGLPWALLCVVLATVIRMGLDRWVEGVPFLTYFPATLVAGLLLGWRWGSVALLASALSANYAFQPPFWAFALSFKQLVSTAGFLLSGAFMLATAQAVRTLLFELELARRREAELNLELSHRVQNNLAIVQSLARQTARGHPNPQAFYPVFRERLIALSAAHGVLISNSFEMAGLPHLTEVALQPFADRDRIQTRGPACVVRSNSAVPLVMVLHELATNSSKYGALSQDDGRVEVQWSLAESTCHLVWREFDGPPVIPPTRTGLGSRLLRKQTGLEDVQLDFNSEGVRCEVVLSGVKSAPTASIGRDASA